MSRKPAKQTSCTARPLTGYGDWLASLKRQVAVARQRAVLAANAEMVRCIGRSDKSCCSVSSPHNGATKCSTGWAATCAGVPRDEGFFGAQPEIHAVFRRALSPAGIWAAACCPISLVPYRHPADQAAHSGSPSVVRATGPCRREAAQYLGGEHPRSVAGAHWQWASR